MVVRNDTFLQLHIRTGCLDTRKTVNPVILSSQEVENDQGNKCSHLKKKIQKNRQGCT